ncbi:hypothetical protein HIM_05725 [Hirsutella minnesotensis 3608]|uniref:SMP-30/Gluconolactonase/LRE-like region domain-containing protein n=1 Tax=Hirsutella minnesotensis 3608 TaxID=1043627 RepID=A0A0F7ZJZ4_9HYPO|nr:hypothetical protein HIM_05725 [Hirsutella minnesotensis 3608]
MVASAAALLCTLLSAAGASAQAVGPAPGQPPAVPEAPAGDCVLPPGNFNISSFQLYPENADFDPKRCLVYFSVLYNATVAVYDVRKKAVVDTIKVRNITGPAIHASGIQYDQKHDKLAILLNAGAAFDTQGADISGDNNLVLYDPQAKKEEAVINLSQTAKEGFRAFQDMEHDDDGNVFVVGSYGGSLLRVGAQDKKVDEWWVGPAPAPAKGLTGLAKLDAETLLVTDQGESQLYRYSMTQRGQREKVVLTGGNLTEALDGVYLPPRYQGRCLLVSDSVNGTLVVRSRDAWKTAEVADIVPNDFLAADGSTAASVQVADRVLAVTEWFLDGGGSRAGNRSEFPMVDITDRVDRSCDPTNDRVVFPDELDRINQAAKNKNKAPAQAAGGRPGSGSACT